MTTMREMVCRLCSRHCGEIGGYLSRVNPLGELPAVWECRPDCKALMSNDGKRVAIVVLGETT